MTRPGARGGRGAPAARFPAESYPGRPPPGPVLVFRGRLWPVVVDGEAGRPVRLAAAGESRAEAASWPVEVDGLERPDRQAASAPRGNTPHAAVLAPGRVRWSLAYGANADPRRLVDKGLDQRGALLLPAALRGWRRVWEARRSPVTGAVPLTVQPDPGARLDVWVLGVDRDDTARLDASEGRGQRYMLARVGPVAVAARFLLDAAPAYAPTAATRVLAGTGGPAAWPGTDQRGAARLLAAGRSAPAVRPAAGGAWARADGGVVEGGGWPSTPLADLPLFVYGTLQPGGQRHRAVAEAVRVVGPAVARGTLFRTPHGWPAAQFVEDGAPLHGTLLAPVSAAAAAGMVAAADAIEDAPRLFRRVAVAVDAGGGARWAMAYAWNRDQGPPPGEVLADGRFDRPRA